MLCGRFSLQDLANIASEILNKTLRFLYQRVGTICSQYFHSRISSDINYGKYPVCKLTFEKLLISDFYFYVERWWETTIDWLFLLARHGVTNLRRSQMMGGGPDQTRPDQLHHSQFLLWPLATNTVSRNRTKVFARSPQPSTNTEVGEDVRSWCSKNWDIRTRRRCAKNHKETC